jgi:hypothetical protein
MSEQSPNHFTRHVMKIQTLHRGNWVDTAMIPMADWEWRIILHLSWLSPGRRAELVRAIAQECSTALTRALDEGAAAITQKVVVGQAEMDIAREILQPGGSAAENHNDRARDDAAPSSNQPAPAPAPVAPAPG